MKVAIIQARLGSTRLPNKVLKKCGSISLLEQVVNRVRSSNVDEIVIATTTNKIDNELYDFCIEKKIEVFRGSENNVLDRFCGVVKKYKATNVIRICSDNPLIMPEMINELIETQAEDSLYSSHYLTGRKLPAMFTGVGFFAELIPAQALLNLNETLDESHPDREHVTKALYFEKSEGVEWVDYNHPELENIRTTIDNQEDLELIEELDRIKNLEKITPDVLAKIFSENQKLYESFCKNEIKNDKVVYYKG